MDNIGIIGAMEIEVAALKEAMKIEKIVNKAGMEFCQGQLGGKSVVVVKSGIGKVNAAMCTQILADDFKVEAVINTGVAGSLNNEINIGDVVISTDLVQHDMDATVFGYPLGQTPQMNIFSIPAHEAMAELARETANELDPRRTVFKGRIVSGDQFVSSNEVKERIQKEFKAQCTEMEGAAIAQAAYLNQLPFVVLRVVSDKADGSASEDYPAFEKKAAIFCAGVTQAMLGKWNIG